LKNIKFVAEFLQTSFSGDLPSICNDLRQIIF